MSHDTYRTGEDDRTRMVPNPRGAAVRTHTWRLAGLRMGLRRNLPLAISVSLRCVMTNSPEASGRTNPSSVGAAALPIVGSPVGTNRHVIDALGGLTPVSVSEWTSALEAVLDDTASGRAKRGTLARRAVEREIQLHRMVDCVEGGDRDLDRSQTRAKAAVMRIGLLTSIGETLDAFFPNLIHNWTGQGHEIVVWIEDSVVRYVPWPTPYPTFVMLTISRM